MSSCAEDYLRGFGRVTTAAVKTGYRAIVDLRPSLVRPLQGGGHSELQSIVCFADTRCAALVRLAVSLGDTLSDPHAH